MQFEPYTEYPGLRFESQRAKFDPSQLVSRMSYLDINEQPINVDPDLTYATTFIESSADKPLNIYENKVESLLSELIDVSKRSEALLTKGKAANASDQPGIRNLGQTAPLDVGNQALEDDANADWENPLSMLAAVSQDALTATPRDARVPNPLNPLLDASTEPTGQNSLQLLQDTYEDQPSSEGSPMQEAESPELVPISSVLSAAAAAPSSLHSPLTNRIQKQGSKFAVRLKRARDNINILKRFDTHPEAIAYRNSPEFLALEAQTPMTTGGRKRKASGSAAVPPSKRPAPAPRGTKRPAIIVAEDLGDAPPAKQRQRRSAAEKASALLAQRGSTSSTS